jgi:hypothetical protein
MAGGGISLQFNEIATKIVLAQFLVEGIIRAVGNIDNTLNDERYNFVNIDKPVITSWHQNSPINSIRVALSSIKTNEMILVFPTNPSDRAQIPRMPKLARGILYAGDFVLHGDIMMGADMDLTNVVDGVAKRFLTVTDATIFPLFPANTSIPEVMPVVLVNRAKVYQLHAP